MTRKELVELSARAALRYHTSMAAAFRRCLGIAQSPPARTAVRHPKEEPTADDIAECIANGASPMDIAVF